MHYFCRSMNRAERDETPRFFSERDRIVNDQEHPSPRVSKPTFIDTQLCNEQQDTV